MRISANKLDERFFESTRGRIVLSLRRSARTVSELAKELGVTDNAVRAHLLALERDGLVEQKGTVKGLRKPHYIYKLAENARTLFPTAYDSLLTKLIAVLKHSSSAAEIKKLLRDVGQTLARDNGPASGDFQQKLHTAIRGIEALGGNAIVVPGDEALLIESDSCPFGTVVSQHPEACKVVESMISETIGRPVREICDRRREPKCRFEIDAE